VDEHGASSLVGLELQATFRCNGSSLSLHDANIGKAAMAFDVEGDCQLPER